MFVQGCLNLISNFLDLLERTLKLEGCSNVQFSVDSRVAVNIFSR